MNQQLEKNYLKFEKLSATYTFVQKIAGKMPVFCQFNEQRRKTRNK